MLQFLRGRGKVWNSLIICSLDCRGLKYLIGTLLKAVDLTDVLQTVDPTMSASSVDVDVHGDLLDGGHIFASESQ